MDFEITEAKARELINNYTKPEQAKAALERLAKGKQFYKTLESPVGKQILQDINDRREELLLKIAKSIGGDKEEIDLLKMEFKVLDNLAHSWAEKIMKYIDETLKANEKILKGRLKNGRN
jgi:uncharacterized coiled-coil DUF342 family protein